MGFVVEIAYRIDDAWSYRPWKDNQRKPVLDKDGSQLMKRCKNGRIKIGGAVFLFSVYETMTQGYLLRGHISLKDPEGHRVMQVSGSERQRIIENLSGQAKEKYDQHKRIRELMIGKDFFVRSDDPAEIRKRVTDAAVDLYMENSKQICRQLQKVLTKDLTAIMACNARGEEYIASVSRNTTEANAKRKLTNLQKACILVSDKKMEDVTEADIGKLKRKLMEEVKEETARERLRLLGDFWEYCLGKRIINGQNPAKAYLADNPGNKRKDPEKLANKEAQARRLTYEVEKKLNANIESNISDGRMMSIVLLNGGGIMPTLQKGLQWKDVIFGDEITRATVVIRRDDILGGTHDYTRPLFHAEARFLRLRYDYLMELYKGNDKKIRSLPIVAKKEDPGAELEETKEITSFVRDVLFRSGVKYSQLASSRNKDRRVGMGTQLLQRNYEAKILECGVESDSGLKDFLLLRRIESVTGDRYRSFTSEEGQRYISNLLGRLGQFDPAPPKHTRKKRFKEGGKEIVRLDAAGPGYCNEIVVEYTLKKGDVISLESGLGMVGEVMAVANDDSEEVTPVDLF